MNDKIPSLLYYLFFGMTAFVACFRFYRTREWQALSLKPLAGSWKSFAMSILPIAALLVAGKLGNFELWRAAPYFAGAALFSFVLSQIGLNPEIRAFVLMMASVGLTILIPTEFYEQAILGTVGGLVTWKLVQNLLHKPDSRLDDITAPLVWLIAYLWSRVGLADKQTIICQEVVLATLTVTSFIRWVQPIIVPNDTIYLKRIMLTLTAGLALLILFTKVMMQAQLGTTVLLGGAGFLLTYLLQSLDKSVDEVPNLARSMKNVLLLGICTLVATRLFGMQGLLVLSAATVVAPFPGSALIAGVFLASRVLIECFITQYNPNVTGVNLMHSYVSGALYAGFLSILVAAIFIKDLRDRGRLLTIMISALVIIPAASNYFLHPEPTSSFLISLGVASVLMAFLAPAVFPNYSADQENLVLLPALGATVAMASQEFLQAGESATTHDRMMALAAIAAIVVVLSLICQFVFATKKIKSQETVPTPEPSAT